MKYFFSLLLLTLLHFCFQNSLNAQSILNPNDPVVDYDPSSPPVEPPYNQIGKWVRTKSMSWNSDSYKAYIYQGSAFRLKFPKSYNPNVNDGKKYPIALVFHGGGEAGPITDNETPLYHGGIPYMNAVDNGKYDGYVMFMQSGGFWGITSYVRIIDILNYMINHNKLDPFSVSANGLSSGGQASWDMVLNYPNYMGASLPMSNVSIGYKDKEVVNKVKFTPMWNFQGELDGSPSAYTAQEVRNAMDDAGGNYRYSEYDNIGHGTWDSAFSEPDFFAFHARAYSSNPWPLFGRTGFCANDVINVTLGVPPGFDGYEWRKNGVLISGANSNTLTATSLGTYSARVLRGSIWSDWSRIPVILQITPPTVAPPITVSGLMSNVIVSGDGKNYVNLEVPDNGYTSYKWRKVGSDNVIGNERIYTATQPGEYTVSVTEKYGCSSVASPPFSVINAFGENAPDAATNLVANAISNTEVSLNWQNKPHPYNNETFFEVYRSISQTGGYSFVGKVPADSLEFQDLNLSPNVLYYYRVRAVNNNGAAALSNIANARTLIDKVPPSAPANLRINYTSNSTISIQWDKSTDNVGVAGYQVYINGISSYKTAELNFIVSGLEKGKMYSLYVKALDSSGNKSAQSNIASAAAVLNGLVYKYYEGYWELMPNFNTLSQISSGVVPNITLEPKKRNIQFAFLWQGYINIPVAGKYKFGTFSTDGSMVWLNTYDPMAKPLVNNDGYHRNAKYRDGGINLQKGRYPITIAYFQISGAKIMQLYWSCQQLFGDTARRLIEDRYFVDSSYLQEGIAPVAPGNISGLPVSYNKVKITWSNNSDNENAFQVYRSTRADGSYQIVHTTEADVTEFIDSSLQPASKYYYRVNAVNDYGTSELSDSAYVKTLRAPASPSAPANLVATALSSSAIRLNWIDVDMAEVSYQVFRSVADNLNYKLAAILPANSNAFTDTALYGNIKYFYKVKAVSVLSSSPNITGVSAKTLNNAPSISNKFTEKYIRFGAQSVIEITATDRDADSLYFSAVNLPLFASFTDNGNGTAALILNPSVTEAGTYQGLKIFVKDEAKDLDSNAFSLIVNDNYSPVADNVSDYTMKEGDVLNIQLNATDQNSADILTWSVQGVPGSYSLIPVSNGNAILKLNPTYIAAGVYNAQATVGDGNGGTHTIEFNLTVMDKDPNLTVFLRFKHQDDVGFPWNDITSVNSSNFKDNLNRNTNIGLQMQTSSWLTWHEGPNTGNNSGIYPDNVLKNYYYFGIYGGPETVTSTLTGLDASKLYNISFYGGSVWIGAPDNGSTIYTIGSQSISLPVQNNTANTADFNNIKPANDGTITFTMAKGANTPAGYINAIVITSFYTDSLKPAAPSSLIATNMPGSGVKLQWNDVAYNETGYKVYRGLNITGPFSLIDGSLPLNTTSFVDSAASGNTQYYYMVKASNDKGLSDSSNVAGVMTTNRAPRLLPIANVTMKNNQQKTIEVIAIDDAADQITIIASNLPSFVTFTDNENGTGEISINPSNGITGTFENITITATDNFDSSNSISFDITVTDQNINSIYVNFSNGTTAPFPWNDFTAWPTANTTLSNLVDDSANVTPVSLKLINGFQGNFVGGMQPGNGKGVYPEVVMRTGIYESSNKIDSILISGLSRSKKYNFVLFNSHDDGLNGKTNFTIGNKTIVLNATQNINKTAQLNGITPNVDGQVILKVSKVAGEDYAYLNSLIIQSYDSSLNLLAPADLRVTAVTKASVALQWADRSADETGFEIWRATDDVTSKYSLLTTMASDVTNFIDSNVSSARTYFYTVRSITATAQSAFCNAVSATTYSQAIYVNFTYVNKATAPWNNTAALPEPGLKWNNFMDDTGVPSSISMEETSLFAGLYGGGVNTGNNSGIFPDKVMVDSYGLFAGQNATMKVSGLNLSMKYDFTFFASSQAGGDVNVAYTVNGTKAVLNASLNTHGTVTIYNIVPDANGEVIITIAPNSSSSQFGLIGALIMQEYKQSNKLIPPPPQAIRRFASSSGNNAEQISKTGNENKLLVYPNPFNRDFTISLSLKKEDDIQVELYTINGKLVSRKNLGHVLKGSSNFKIFTDQNLPRGMYLLKIIYLNAKETQYQKVLKQ